MTGELLIIHVGQYGIQSSNALWELLCLEHSISPDGVQTYPDDDSINSNVYFHLTNNNNRTPRCIFVDAEPTVIDEIKNGAYRNLFKIENMIYGKEDSASNFARGSFLCGGQIIKPFRNCLRKLINQVDRLEGVILCNSYAGGSGSGMGALFLQQLLLDYPKIHRMQFALYPSQIMSTSVVEPYNAVFHSHTTIETCDLSVIFDNESMYNLCQNLISINSPSFNNINRLLGLMVSSATATMRFTNSMISGMNELYTNLIPYPRIHHTCIRQAPYCHISKMSYEKRSAEDITKNVFSKEYQTIKCELMKGKMISVVLNYRGYISPSEVSNVIPKIKEKANLQFVEWAPTGFKIGMNNSLPVFTPEYNLYLPDKIVTLLANTTAIKQCWVSLNRKFDLLYDKKSFVWWYINEGIEESEFQESRVDLQLLVEDYQEISMTEDEILEEMEENQKDQFEQEERTEQQNDPYAQQNDPYVQQEAYPAEPVAQSI